MEYTPRQFVHMIGIATALVLTLWAADRWYQARPRLPVANVHQFTWLASMNMREADRISKPLIQSGEVAMLLARHSEREVINLKSKLGFAQDGKQNVIPLLHLDRNGDELINASDPLYRKLFIGYYHGGQLQVMPLAKSHIRAIVVHRRGKQIRYHAVLSGGIQWPMEVAPQSRPYSPLLGD